MSCLGSITCLPLHVLCSSQTLMSCPCGSSLLLFGLMQFPLPGKPLFSRSLPAQMLSIPQELVKISPSPRSLPCCTPIQWQLTSPSSVDTIVRFFSPIFLLVLSTLCSFVSSQLYPCFNSLVILWSCWQSGVCGFQPPHLPIKAHSKMPDIHVGNEGTK